jgi:hypothetical protein
MPITPHSSAWFVREKEALSYRSWTACGGWIVILAALSISAVFSAEAEVRTLLVLSLAYGVQGCFAELIGVKIDSSGISFPNRIFPKFPYLILFRRKLPKGSFDRIDIVGKQILMIYPARDQIWIAPTKTSNKNTFVRHLRNTFPTVSVKVT